MGIVRQITLNQISLLNNTITFSGVGPVRMRLATVVITQGAFGCCFWIFSSAGTLRNQGAHAAKRGISYNIKVRTLSNWRMFSDSSHMPQQGIPFNIGGTGATSTNVDDTANF